MHTKCSFTLIYDFFGVNISQQNLKTTLSIKASDPSLLMRHFILGIDMTASHFQIVNLATKTLLLIKLLKHRILCKFWREVCSRGQVNWQRWRTTFKNTTWETRALRHVPRDHIIGKHCGIFADLMFINKPLQIETLQIAQTMKSLSRVSDRQLLVSFITISKIRLSMYKSTTRSTSGGL